MKYPKEISEALISIGFESFVEKQLTVKQAQFDRQLNVWFDAFKTLKFIHSVRDEYYPNIPLSQAIELSNFTLK